MLKRWVLLLCLLLIFRGSGAGQTLNCSLRKYRPLNGLRAGLHGSILEFTWQGERGDELRADFAIRNGQPLVSKLEARKARGGWLVLGRNLVPEFQVTSGMRRLSQTQASILRRLYGKLTPQLINQQKWFAFWDAPLDAPAFPEDGSTDLPRQPEEIRRAWATFHATGCEVKTDGARLEVTFPGLDMGIFSGHLRFTVYRGSNLLRQEAIASTERPSVAYKYVAGLKGFSIGPDTRVVWRDTARAWQHYDFGGAVNTDPVGLRARNRLGLIATGGGSVGFFPPSHKFFFARENAVNLGYVYYRKDNGNSFAAGVRQPGHGEGHSPFGISGALWNRMVRESRAEVSNFALYNAPPGTEQRMAVYFYLSPRGARVTQRAVLAYTHGDVYKPVPGFKVLVSHFHVHFTAMMLDHKTFDYRDPPLDVFQGLGINIVILLDFHTGALHANDPGPLRLEDQKAYFTGAGRFSDRNFLIIPAEEANVYLGGHYVMVLPHPVYWTHARAGRLPGQAFMENVPPYGEVYHVTSAAEVMKMLRREDGLIWTAHPRTKASAGYPDAIRDKRYFLWNRFIGASFENLPADLSQKRLCQVRCLGTLADMNNWARGPKYMIAEGDTYTKFPDDETYDQLSVNYVKLNRVPQFQEGWSPVLRALQAGNFFVTTGEILFHRWGIQGSGMRCVYTAEVEWTFPPGFAELVWGDGHNTSRQIIPLTEMPPFGSHEFRIPFNAGGKKWVYFAIWDSAGNGAFTEPVHLK